MCETATKHKKERQVKKAGGPANTNNRTEVKNSAYRQLRQGAYEVYSVCV